MQMLHYAWLLTAFSCRNIIFTSIIPPHDVHMKLNLSFFWGPGGRKIPQLSKLKGFMESSKASQSDFQ